MPTYRIINPEGKSLRIVGDKPPTEEELNQIFAKLKTSPTPPASPKEDYAMLSGKGLANIIPGLAYATQYYQNLGNISKANEAIKPFEALKPTTLRGQLAEATPTALGRLPFYMSGAGGMASALGRPIVGGSLGFGGMGGLEQVLQGTPEQAPRAALQSAFSYPVLHGIGKGAGLLPNEVSRRLGAGLGFGGYSALTSSPEDRAVNTILGTGLGVGFKHKPKSEYLAQKANKLEKSAVEIYRKTVGVKPHELKNIEIRKGGNLNDAFKIMADENIPLSETPEGSLETSMARQILKNRINTMSNELENFLKRDVSTRFSLDEIANKAKKAVDENISNAKEAKDSKNEIDDYIQAEKYRYGKNIDGSIIPAETVDAFTLNRIKQGMWSVGYDQMKITKQSNARKIGRAIADTLNSKYPNSPIQKLNNKMSDYLTALSILETPRKSPTSGIGAGAARVTGAMIGGMIGNPFPVIGAAGGGAAGYALGGKIYKTIKSPQRQSNRASAKMSEAQKIKMLNPQVRQILQQIISGQYKPTKIGF